MKLTKEFIMNRINRLLITFKESWENILVELDAGIMEINSWMSTRFPLVSDVLDPNDPDSTYSYNVGGKETPFFNNKYFMNVVIPFAAAELLSIDEEFGEVYSKYKMQAEDNLFLMVRDEVHNIHHQFAEDFKGVYFSDPHPIFKRNPEKFFNIRKKLPEEKYKIKYEWGNYYNHLPHGAEAFVSSALPVDNNLYKKGEHIPLSRISNNIHNVFLVDNNRQVLGVFIGWSYSNDNDRNKVINSDRILVEEKDIKVYGVFDLRIIGIEYNGNGGTLSNWKPQYVPVKVGENQTISPYGGIGIRTGFSFEGFSPAYIPQEFLSLYKDSVGEFTFYAIWEKEQYTITYINRGEITEANYSYGDIVELPFPKPSLINTEDFIGWWDNPMYEGDPITEIKRSEHGDKIFYAKYNSEEAIITWVVKGRDSGSFTFVEEQTKGSILKNIPPEIMNNINNNPDFEFITSSGKYQLKSFIKPGPVDVIELEDSSKNSIILNQSIIKKEMTIYIKSHIKEDIMIELSFYDLNEGSPNSNIPSLTIYKGFSKNNLIQELHSKFEELSVVSYFNYNETIYSFSGFNIDEVVTNINGSIIEDSNIYLVYESKHINVIAYKTEVVYSHSEGDAIEALSLTGENSGDIIDALNWDQEGTHTIEDAIFSLIFEFSNQDIYINSLNNYYEYNNPVGIGDIIQLNNALLHLKNQPEFQETINFHGFNIYFQNQLKYKVQETETILNFPEELDVSDIYNNNKTLELYPVFDVLEPVVPFSMMGFSSPIAEIKFEDKTIKTFYYYDLEETEQLKINFNDYVSNIRTSIDENNYFDGYKINGNKIKDQLNIYELNELLENGSHKVFTITPSFKQKMNFEIELDFNIDKNMTQEIKTFMTEEDETLYDKIIESYEEYILSKINNPIIINYTEENNGVIVFTEEDLHNIFSQETKFLNLKTRFDTGMRLKKYSYKGNDYFDFPISVQLPEATGEVQNIKVELELALETEFPYKRIFISNEVYLENGSEVEVISLIDEIENYKELFVSVPMFDSFIDYINLDVFEGLTDIKFYDYFDNEITNGIITENMYVKIRARRV